MAGPSSLDIFQAENPSHIPPGWAVTYLWEHRRQSSKLSSGLGDSVALWSLCADMPAYAVPQTAWTEKVRLKCVAPVQDPCDCLGPGSASVFSGPPCPVIRTKVSSVLVVVHSRRLVLSWPTGGSPV